MPRRPRLEGAGATHHVVAQGNRRRSIVVDDLDRLDLVRRLAACSGAHEWSCSAYCLLDTHFHLVVTTRTPNLGLGMQRLLGDYARAYNRRHGLEGHLFRRPYFSRRISTETHLYASYLYVVLNPVVAGLCDHPEEWFWSSYRQTAFGQPGFVTASPVLACFGSDENRARNAYRNAVSEASRQATAERAGQG